MFCFVLNLSFSYLRHYQGNGFVDLKKQRWHTEQLVVIRDSSLLRIVWWWVWTPEKTTDSVPKAHFNCIVVPGRSSRINLSVNVQVPQFRLSLLAWIRALGDSVTVCYCCKH